MISKFDSIVEIQNFILDFVYVYILRYRNVVEVL